MRIDREIYSVFAVRLVNFHNINAVTIPLKNGGHLFLMGDNGSGKTTILDAIHYVLSAGEDVELNSAARLGGSKANGRRINGVVTAYNVDTGARFPDGRVTYAALELRNESGNPVCIGIGLSIAGANAPLQQWGFRCAGPISGLPLLLKDENGQEYPPDRDEFKKAILKMNGRYYMGMTSFSQALAREFFPTSAQYHEYRKFLNMCKAYREISSRAGNYHELFKSLLPEPDAETLQELRNSLRDLRESNSALNSLEKRCAYLGELNSIRQRIDHLRLEIRILNVGLLYFDREKQLIRLEGEREKMTGMSEELEKLRQVRSQSESRIQTAERTIADLKDRDSSSLIETEKSRARMAEQLRLQVNQLHDTDRALSGQKAQLTADLGTIRGELRETLNTLSGKLSEELSDWPELPLETALSAVQQAQVSTAANPDLDFQPLQTLENSFGGYGERLKYAHQTASESAETAKREFLQAEEELKKLEAMPEAMPEHLPHYNDMLADLNREMIPADPLYLRLHWRRNLSPGLRSAVEELIGEDILCTVTAENEYADRIRKILRSDYPGCRFAPLYSAEVPAPSGPIREFLDRFFDSEHDAAWLDVLAREMDGFSIPEFENAEDPGSLTWRGTYRVLCGIPAKLIGEDERKAEQKRRIADAKEVLESRVEIRKNALSRFAETEKRLKVFKRFTERIIRIFEQLRRKLSSVSELNNRMAAVEKSLTDNSGTLEIRKQELDDAVRNLNYLRSQIKERNLESLDTEIRKATEELNGLKQVFQLNNNAVVSAETRFCDFQEQHQKHEKEFEETDRRYSESLTSENGCRTGESLCRYLAEHQIADKDACSGALAIQKKDHNVLIGNLTAKIMNAEGIEYGFSYNEESNELFSREHRTIGELFERLQTAVQEQREILNADTRRNFERILLEQFRSSLRQRIFSLENMEKKINRILAGHTFGLNTYSLKVTPLPEYAALVRVIRSFSDQIPESSEELKDIFMQHANEILDTPADILPPVLDYRNYFQYNMLLHAAGSGDKVMDTRTKSVGSGGEQAVPNYLLVMMIAHLLFDKTEGTSSRIKINTILFDEAFYGIDPLRQNQLLAFAEELGLQLMIASPNQDGMKVELASSTNIFVRKDKNYQVHLNWYNWTREPELLTDSDTLKQGEELE